MKKFTHVGKITNHCGWEWVESLRETASYWISQVEGHNGKPIRYRKTDGQATGYLAHSLNLSTIREAN